MLEYLKAVKNVDIPSSGGELWDFINNMSFPVATVVIGLLVLFAVQGYKIFKSVIYVIAAVGLGFAGHLYLAPKVSGLIVPHVPESWLLDVDVAIAFICAMFGVLIAHLAYDFVVFCLGGVSGYLAGYFFIAPKLVAYFSKLKFLDNNIAKIAIGVVVALMVAIIFLLLFKHIYIITTSIGFMALSGYLLSKEVMPGQSNTVIFAFIAVCVVVGVFMMVHQFDEESKSKDFSF